MKAHEIIMMCAVCIITIILTIMFSNMINNLRKEWHALDDYNRYCPYCGHLLDEEGNKGELWNDSH